MANTNTNKGITEVQALTAVLNGDPITGELREKLEHMLDIRAKKRSRKTDTSKRDANRLLGEAFAKQWVGETFKASDVREVLNLPTVSKASAIIRAMGWAAIPTSEKVKVYTFATED